MKTFGHRAYTLENGADGRSITVNEKRQFTSSNLRLSVGAIKWLGWATQHLLGEGDLLYDHSRKNNPMPLRVMVDRELGEVCRDAVVRPTGHFADVMMHMHGSSA